jgi:ATP-dependent NAD(P)H-hydrate dehydratase
MPVSRSLLDSLKKIIPPLDGSLHKGQSGRVGVIGGAQEYVPTFPLSYMRILNV